MRRSVREVMFADRGLRLAGVLLLSLSIALVATAATPRAGCACTTKEKAYVATMKADLRNLVTAQESFFADSGRYAASWIELDSTRYRLTTGVELVRFEASADGFSARVHFPSRVSYACWMSVGTLPNGGENLFDGEPQCDPPPRAMYPIITGSIYGALLLLALGIRLGRAGNGLPPVTGGTVFGFAALCVLHPYWPLDRRDSSCYSNAEAAELLWVVMMAVIALWMAVRRVRNWEPPRAA